MNDAVGYKRALVAGWFSYPNRKVTFGDVAAKDVVCAWLTRLRIPFDVAGHPLTRVEGVNIERVNPIIYDLFIFVCGPWAAKNRTLARFNHCYKIGVDLSISDAAVHGFDAVLPRDMSGTVNPDIVLNADTTLLPLAGIILVHPQPMYGNRQRHDKVGCVVEEFLETNRVAPIRLDTLILDNDCGIRTQAQFESVIRRVDFVISSRLHGMVFAIKNGIPVIAIDPIAGGAKVTAQAKTVGWPLLLDGDALTVEKLAQAVDACLGGAMRETAVAVGMAAADKVRDLERQFGALLRNPGK